MAGNVAISCGHDEPLRATPLGDGTQSGGTSGSGAAAGSGAHGGSPGSSSGTGGSSGSGGVAGTNDAGADSSVSSDAGFDAPDAADSGPGPSLFCGDAIRDPVTEECDDGPGTAPDSCDETCRVRDVLVGPNLPGDGPLLPPGRELGPGRHTVAAGTSGFAVVFVEDQVAPAAVKLRTFGKRGEPAPALIGVNGTANAFADSAPVIAALPAGKYAVAWTNLGGDGDGRGIAFRIVDPANPSSGALSFANATRSSGQQRPDILATDSEIIVAWTDDGNVATRRADVYYRRLSLSGTALGPTDEPLASTAASEDLVTLGRWGASWAAAWLALDSSGQSIRVKAGTREWTIGPLQYGTSSDRIALAEIDATHLFVAFIAVIPGRASLPEAPRLQWAVLDTAAPGPTTWLPLEPMLEPEPLGLENEHAQPSVVRTEDALYVAWQLHTPGGSDDEVWLKRIGIAPADGGVTLDFSAPEISLPRGQEHRVGAQRTPALAATQVPGSAALVAAWDDAARTFGPGAGAPDVVAQLIPTPIVRLEGGSGEAIAAGVGR